MMSPPATTTCWEWRATGTIWRIHHSGGVSVDAAQRITALVAQHEARWSRFRAGSEISRINAAAGEAVAVSRETVDLVAACVTWVRHTGGVFHPLVGGAVRAWGYEDGLQRRPSGAASSPAPERVFGDIEIDPVRLTVRIPEGCLIDVGGIAKGWIVDRCRAPLAEATDDPSVLLDAGGDLLAVRGRHAVAVIHDGALCGSVSVAEGAAVATSGYSLRRWVNGDGMPAHHLIDPATGRPGALVHATAVAGSATAADVQATYLALRPGAVDADPDPALVTLPDGSRRASSGWLGACAA
jgi:FAD:protein FMN transferase